MDGIAVATKRGYLNVAIGEFFLPGFGFGAIADKFVERAMLVVRISAGADLHGFEAQGGDAIEHGIERSA